MTRHRAAPPPRRRADAPGRRRAEPTARLRPRYGRLAALGASASVTGIAVLGSLGVLPSVATGSSPAPDPDADRVTTVLSAGEPSPTATPTPTPTPAPAEAAPTPEVVAPAGPPAVPADSGEGRRVVFDQSDQRVWLVRDDESVARTYLVSGSVTDNLAPGTFEVYSRSAHAVGIDESGTMRYFVRFTEGTNGAAIGFHDIPVNDGEPLQTTDQLGVPQSHGCIRQPRKDAIALWGFAPIGTEVDVVA